MDETGALGSGAGRGSAAADADAGGTADGTGEDADAGGGAGGSVGAGFAAGGGGGAAAAGGTAAISAESVPAGTSGSLRASTGRGGETTPGTARTPAGTVPAGTSGSGTTTPGTTTPAETVPAGTSGSATAGTATIPAETGRAGGAGIDFRALRDAEYPGLDAGYLNTATLGLAPARTIAALRRAVEAWAVGRPDVEAYEAAVAASRVAYARITGVPVERVALASTVAGAVGLVAARLPAGAEVVVAEGDFSALVHPFAGRADLALRIVPLAGVAAAVRAGTALVAVSAAQSADGRVADLAAIRAAASEHGARVLVDGTQSVGWLPIVADEYDYVICHGYKWLLSPHGACFLTVRDGAEPTLSPAFAGWYAADDPWSSCYGPIDRLAPGARQFDARPAYLSFIGAAASLGLIAEIGVAAIHTHDVSLADRLREGLATLGHPAVPGDSAIVAVSGLPDTASEALTKAGVRFAARAGNLRFALHVHNGEEDVDLVLNALAGT